MKGYLLSTSARADLDSIWDYTAENWSKDQAERYVLAIRSALDNLAAGRSRARLADDIRRGYRKYAVGSHLLFFRVSDVGNIDVIRILHQRMDVAAQFKGNE